MSDQQRYRILLIDDDAATGRLVRKHMERIGHAVHQAGTVAEGRAACRAEQYDVIILDQSLPDGDGLQLFRELAAEGPLPPVIMFTSTGDEDLAVQAMKAGLSDYLVKGSPDSFLRSLQEAIERARQVRQRQIEDVLRQHHDRLEELVDSRTAALAGANAELERANRQLEFEIAERWQVELALRESQRMLSLQNRIADVFLTVADEDMYDKALAAILEATVCEYGVFGYLDEEGALLTPSLSRRVWDTCQIPDKTLRFPRHTWGNSLWARAILNKRSICSNQPARVPAGHVPLHRVLASPILYQGNVIGLFMVANKATDFTADDQELLDNVARFVSPPLHARLERERQERRRRAAEEALTKQTLELSQRVKEMDCLRTITEIIQESDYREEEFLRAVVNVIPSGWRHPEVVCARIVFEGHVSSTQNFNETPWKLSAPILIKGSLAGGLEVCYLEERPSEDGQPFSSEEQMLLNDVAERVGRVLERARAEAENASLKRQIEFILGATKTGLSIVDADQRLVYVDPNRCKRYGDFAGRSYREYFGTNHLLQVALDRALCTKRPAITEAVIPMDNNQPIQMTVMPYQDDRGRWLAALMSVDLTERKVMERELAQAQRLEAIGHLAAGIAHEINTPTQYVADNLHFLRDGVRDLGQVIEACQRLLQAAAGGSLTSETMEQAQTALRSADLGYLLEEMPRAIEQSIEGTVRVAGIVRAMKQFSHPANEGKQAADLNRVIESTLTISRNEWKYVADVESDLDPSLPQIECLPNEISQVILNLVVNAAHAIAKAIADGIRDRGVITVRTRRLEAYAEIDVEDTGTGIPEDIRSKIFDPFFTTKEVGKGTGQGLSIAHTIVVKRHGGTIHLDTEVGRGTTFTIRLPLESTDHNPAEDRTLLTSGN